MPRHPDFDHIYQNFIRQYGAEKGEQFYHAWLNKNGLDDTKPYDVGEQYFSESFKWAKPAIRLVKEDEDAKWYMVRAATANISMNRNDYRDTQQQMMAARSLSHRPLNMNHDHSKWLPFPDARVHFANYEDNTVETLIRIPKSLPAIIKKLDDGLLPNPPKGAVTHVSIEGFPLEGYGRRTGEGFEPQLYAYTALALLEKGEQLPGDPLTTIDPLTESVQRWSTPIDESLGHSLVESLNMTQEKGIVKGADQQTIGKGEGPDAQDLYARRKTEMPQIPLGGDAVMPTTPTSPPQIQPLPRESQEPDVLEQYLKETIELKRKIADQTDAIREKDSRISVLEEDAAKQRRKTAEQSSHISKLEKDQLDNTSKIMELDQHLRDRDSRVAIMDTTITQKDSQIRKFKEQIDEVQERYTKAVGRAEDLNQKNTDNLKSLNETSTALAAAKTDLSKRDKDVVDARREVAASSEDNAKLTRQVADLTDDARERAKKLYAVEQECAKLRDDNETLSLRIKRFAKLGKIVVKI